ncbi:alpha/beta fold hydrolase [Halomonas salifodinae]|uniref:Alpha/beta fold hydrolase n=1 Tax=Halomonas salifodinae TaxID=438745 RepID=A0ABW2F3K5_9GAMM
MDDLALIPLGEAEVAVRIWHPRASRTLIAWHGLSRHGGDFAPLARLLGPDWRILAPDTPGRGLSSWPLFPAYDYRYERYQALALQLLDHFALPRVAWLGTSMGGLLGMLLAADAQHGRRIERLILNDVGPELELQGLVELGGYFAMPRYFSRFGDLCRELRRHHADFGISDERDWRELALNSARRLPDGGWTFHYDPRIVEQFIHDRPRDTWQDWAALGCPLMAIRGARSGLLSQEVVARMARVQPDLVTLEVADCGHAPMLDTPAQVKPIRDFLVEAPRPGWRRRLRRLLPPYR